jgi:hypothetical protein
MIFAGLVVALLVVVAAIISAFPTAKGERNAYVSERKDKSTAA